MTSLLTILCSAALTLWLPAITSSALIHRYAKKGNSPDNSNKSVHGGAASLLSMLFLFPTVFALQIGADLFGGPIDKSIWAVSFTLSCICSIVSIYFNFNWHYVLQKNIKNEEVNITFSTNQKQLIRLADYCNRKIKQLKLLNAVCFILTPINIFGWVFNLICSLEYGFMATALAFINLLSAIILLYCTNTNRGDIHQSRFSQNVIKARFAELQKNQT